ncbi:hypothetical protein ACWEN6_16770 [Sphaerisporangium sp. NPDC004334]
MSGGSPLFAQTCIKGVTGISFLEAEEILAGSGLLCNWWRRVRLISPNQVDERLTSANLNLHVNSYDAQHPQYDGLVREETPFISLTAGAVERSVFYSTNLVHPAHQTALLFASDFGRARGECYLFYCWVIVGMNPAAEVRHLAEEVRELNTYRRYSAFQSEGEVAAKVEVPARQIHRFERYEISSDGRGLRLDFKDAAINPRYVDPYSVVNIRGAF